jgi:hypothetical protein
MSGVLVRCLAMDRRRTELKLAALILGTIIHVVIEYPW